LPGLAAAIAIAAWIEAVVLFVLLHRRVPELAAGPIISLGVRSLIVTVVASLAAAVVSAALAGVIGADPSRVLLLVRMIAAGAAWAVVGVGAAIALRIGELRSIVGLMVDATRGPRRS
jgi:peptidoglycan biosynthesis protein MviN/MurJ (putative lipid II flippase)